MSRRKHALSPVGSIALLGVLISLRSCWVSGSDALILSWLVGKRDDFPEAASLFLLVVLHNRTKIVVKFCGMVCSDLMQFFDNGITPHRFILP